MKAPFNILLCITLVLFGSCRTKREASPDSVTMLRQQPGADTNAKNQVRPYYYPRLNTQLPRAKVTLPVITTKDLYELAYKDLADMLEGRTEADFELAVFISENPYHHGQYHYSAFQKGIDAHLQRIKKMIAANDKSNTMDFNAYVNENGRFKLSDIRYLPDEKKKLYLNNLSNWAIFAYLTDTVYTGSVKDSLLIIEEHLPYSYATSDPFGKEDWAHSQVMNLLISEKNEGNCFALTALYKILADRLHTGAKICTAPQHIYIQHQDAKGQYYNVELATAGHPGDGIIQTLTYTPTEAIMSGIALRDYTTQQSIGLCLVNLAKGYEHTFETKDHAFILRCAELALKYDSLNLNALLLKQQVLDARVVKYAKENRINTIQKLKQDTGIAETVLYLEQHLELLYKLGYRQMPLDMQSMILNQLQSKPGKWDRQSRNARPFTSFEPKETKDAEYWTLTAGMFKEVWEPTATEVYGHFTITTASGKLKGMDTLVGKEPLIDPVAFAYDFGARMYDARIGRWTATDPVAKKYPSMSPYGGFGGNPIFFIDNGGRTLEVGGNVTKALADIRSLVPKEYQSQIQINSAGKIEFQGYDKLPDAVKSYEGVKLLNDLITSASNYKYSVDNSTPVRLRPTGEAAILPLKTSGENITAQEAMANLSKTSRTDVADGDYLPEAGFDGTVTIADGEFTRENPQVPTTPFTYSRNSVVFHELKESFLRTESGQDYSEAHKGSSSFANKFSREINGKGDPYGGYGTGFTPSVSGESDPQKGQLELELKK